MNHGVYAISFKITAQLFAICGKYSKYVEHTVLRRQDNVLIVNLVNITLSNCTAPRILTIKLTQFYTQDRSLNLIHSRVHALILEHILLV
jgi:hypothetical protein